MSRTSGSTSSTRFHAGESTPYAGRWTARLPAGRLSAAGVVVQDGAYHPVIGDYERALGEIRDVWMAISSFESVWPMQTYRDRDASLLGKPILGALARGEKMSLDDYRRALRRRDEIRAQHAAMAGYVDAFVTLSSPGPAPEGMSVGDCIYNEASSILGAPALSLPLLAVNGLPQGVQLLGFNHEDYRKEQTFQTDVVVVGTGAGGAVAGAELAEEGLDVLFVEEGAYHPTSSFNPYLTESIPRLYRDVSATMIHGNPVIPYVEGRALGGSTVINGGMTWRTPERVLDQWQKVTGDSSLGPKGLEPLFKEIEKSIQSNFHAESSFGESNRIMLEGAKKMGWKVEINRRNQNQCVGTNSCGLGCPTGAKQSTLVSHIPRAMNAGARCLTEVRIEKLIVEKGRCVGVIGRAIDPVTRKADKKVTIRARAVVIACGGIQTPHLLLKQKPGKKNRHLGQHFSCHPNAKVAAIYPHDVRAWKGVSQWTQIREFHEEGIVMAENMITPGALAAFIPWHGKKAMALLERYNNIILSGVLVEDSTCLVF